MTLSQYVTLDEADAYLESVLDTEAWDLSTDVRRTKALKQATRMIQALNVPDFVDPVPADIIAATVEIAIRLLDGYDADVEIDGLAVQSLTFDGLKQVNGNNEVQLHVLAGIPSAYAFNILRGYMPNLNTIHLSRTD